MDEFRRIERVRPMIQAIALTATLDALRAGFADGLAPNDEVQAELLSIAREQAAAMIEIQDAEDKGAKSPIPPRQRTCEVLPFQAKTSRRPSS